MSEQQENTKALKALFAKYLKGEVTAEERERIDLWYASLDRVLAEREQVTDTHSTQRIRKDILSQLRKVSGDKSAIRRLVPVLKYAASTVLLSGLALYGIKYSAKTPQQAVAQVITTASGIQKNIVLTDGSSILLNAESKLIVSADFNSKDRKVILVGEAFFHIAKDKKRPFIIRSGDLKTTVLGTSFNINAYPGMENIKISVATGTVKVARTMAQDVDGLLSSSMVKDQTLVFNNKTKIAQIREGNTALLSAWDKGELYIDNASLPDIAKQLSRHYRIPVKLSPDLGSADRYTVRLENETIASSIRVLSDLTHLKFIVKQNQLYIMNGK